MLPSESSHSQARISTNEFCSDAVDADGPGREVVREVLLPLAAMLAVLPLAAAAPHPLTLSHALLLSLTAAALHPHTLLGLV